jgi:hypothetical protein
MPVKQLDPIRQIAHSVFQDVTPVRLRLLLVANCLAALFFCLVAVSTINQNQHAVKTVVLDAAPSVIAAHQIKIGVEQMDAALIDQLLVAPNQDESKELARQFDKWRVTAAKELIAAAKNITYGQSEQIPLENIADSLGQFEMQSQTALDMHNLDRNSDAVSAYRLARQTLTEKLFPNADALNKANADALESTYSQAESESALSCGFVLVVGMLLVALLVVTQMYLSKRFRRRVNVPLLIATICTFVFVQHLYSALRENDDRLKVAKEDAYNSMVALLDARANAYDADAAESRFLLLGGKDEDKYFFDKAATVANFTQGHDFAQTTTQAEKQLASGEKINLPGFSGSLADELNNVRFEGEGKAALESLSAFGGYLQADKKMRQLETSGAHQAAIKVALGYDPEGSKFPFTKFDDALGRTLEINQNHFNLAVKDAFDDLNGLVMLSEVVSLLIAVCAYIGLRRRMEEYLY